MPISSAGRNYLTHDSFVDCTDLFEISKEEIQNQISQGVCRQLDVITGQDFENIVSKVIDSDLISIFIKRKFGF